MTVFARDIAAAIRDRLPGVGTVALHKLLYYCQGHHLAAFGVPLFPETISAWDRGPVVGALWREEKFGAQAAPDEHTRAQPLDEAALNTVGYVISRYGALSGRDLENLSHSEAPWQTANATRQPGGRVTIRIEWVRDYFLTNGYPAAGEDEEPPLDSDGIRDWLSRIEPSTITAGPDSRDGLLARLNG
jgi:uncharacterized phage-associated protein